MIYNSLLFQPEVVDICLSLEMMVDGCKDLKKHALKNLKREVYKSWKNDGNSDWNCDES